MLYGPGVAKAHRKAAKNDNDNDLSTMKLMKPVEIKEFLDEYVIGKLSSEGIYEVNADVKAKLKEEFAAGFCDDAQTKATIHAIYEKYSYTCDTHTAVAVKVYNDYKSTTGDMTKTVIASTASPYKFSAAVLEALEGKTSDIDEYDKVGRIAELSDIPIPAALADLKNKPERFNDVIDKKDQKNYVLKTLGI